MKLFKILFPPLLIIGIYLKKIVWYKNSSCILFLHHKKRLIFYKNIRFHPGRFKIWSRNLSHLTFHPILSGWMDYFQNIYYMASLSLIPFLKNPMWNLWNTNVERQGFPINYFRAKLLFSKNFFYAVFLEEIKTDSCNQQNGQRHKTVRWKMACWEIIG